MNDKCRTCPIRNIEVPNILINSSICIVGESPGTEEEREGKPFVGASGKLLNKVLEEVLGVTRVEVAVLNACKCRIPDAVKKTKSVLKNVVKNCREFLYDDIKRVTPKVIIPLGEVALSQVMGKWMTISRNRGKLMSNPELGCYVYPLVHPSFILRTGGATDKNPHYVMWKKDLEVLKKLIENDFKKSELEFMAFHTASDFSRSPIFAVDCEWDDTGKLLCFSISDGKVTRYIDMETIDTPTKEMLRKMCLYKRAMIVANRPVDERVLESNGINMPIKKLDLFNIANLVNENMKISLEVIADVYTNKHRIKDTTEKVKKKVWEMSKEELVRYNCIDTEATAEAFFKLYRELKKDDKLFRYWKNFTVPVEEMLASITKNGFPIDIEKLKMNKSEVEAKLLEMEMELISKIDKRIIRQHQDKGIRLTRTDLIIDYLFNSAYGLKLKPIKKTATGKPAVDEGSLKEYSHEWVKKLLEWKKLFKLKTTYFDGLERNIKNGRIYPNLVLWGTTTGRTICFNPNIQQVPRGGLMVDKLKELYEAPDGYVMCARDLSQSELRIVAWLSNEKNMLKAMREGVDLHSLTASLVLGKPIEEVTKADRQLAKAVNFGLIYGQGAEGLRIYAKENYGVEMSYDEAEHFRTMFFKKYPALEIYHRRCITIARKHGYIRSPLGRVRRLPDINSNDLQLVKSAERQAINFPVQSFSSDLGLIGMYLFWRKIKDKKSVWLLWFIHDAVFFICREDLVDKYMSMLKYCMEEESKKYIRDKFGIKVTYPIASDGKVGQNWANLKEYKDVAGE